MRKNCAITIHILNERSLALCCFGHNAFESTQQKQKSISYESKSSLVIGFIKSDFTGFMKPSFYLTSVTCGFIWNSTCPPKPMTLFSVVDWLPKEAQEKSDAVKAIVANEQNFPRKRADSPSCHDIGYHRRTIYYYFIIVMRKIKASMDRQPCTSFCYTGISVHLEKQ